MRLERSVFYAPKRPDRESSFFRSVSAVILAVSATQSWARPIDLIELTGQVGFSCSTGTGGFENYCFKGENVERGAFRLVYDPLIPDTDRSTNTGLFRGTIRSFEMTVSQVNRADLAFSLVGQGNFYRGSLDPDWVTWSMILKEENDVIETSWFSFGMYNHSAGHNPNEMPNIDFWSHPLVGLVGGGAGVNETDWLSSPISARTIPRPIPVPSSLWLLLIGAAGALVQQGRVCKRY